ncbi:MAG: M14 family zinc carboxypeptidase [Cyclobacteriaceae bacterium]
MNYKTLTSFLLTILVTGSLYAQGYFLKDKGPFDSTIPTPEEFLGYGIGSHHTRHDRIVAYLDKLAEVSDRATIARYGKTHEYRDLVILTVTSPQNHSNIETLRTQHLKVVDPNVQSADVSGLPIFINLGYNVHGNEPSSSEAALLTAYTLVASQSDEVKKYLDNGVIFIDPTINPDGRDRHSSWANTYKGDPLVKDPIDAEHNEAWPRGRTNHYWFDLNRDWLLGINPESRGKLAWYHQWYPNVVTDFHEMGTNSTYFFEPMKAIASKNPIMPKENYTTLNNTFAKYFQEDLDKIGSFYFTKEVFDGTYPGYGSSYPDLQGGLALLFEQASSRGHLQESRMGDVSFAFTIRNQYTSSLATVRAAIENKDLLYSYQRNFFESAISNANGSGVKGYVFGDEYDENRVRAFIDKLLLHKVWVYELNNTINAKGKTFKPGKSFIVPTSQPQYRMVQTFFETYSEYSDSVYYDASAWSVANFYNMSYAPVTSNIRPGNEVTRATNVTNASVAAKSDYAYLISWEDYNAPAVLYGLQKSGVTVNSAFKPFTIETNSGTQDFGYGTLVIPVSRQSITRDSLYQTVSKYSKRYNVNVFSTKTGYSSTGIDLGSGNIATLEKPNVLMWIEGGVSSYEAGEVWHLMDTRVKMPVTKVPLRLFNRVNFEKYNVMIMVSGSYNELDSAKRIIISDWVKKGNTLITSRGGTSWAINQKLVKESLIKEDKEEKEKKENEPVVRRPFVNASENSGKKSVGGAIFEVDLDLTHPLAFGYRNARIPVYRNSTIWLAPSKNSYSTVAKYTDDPHIDGFISDENMEKFLKPSASLIVSGLGRGRVIMFADNPNFRGSWYGTNRLFLNAVFLGQQIYLPGE